MNYQEQVTSGEMKQWKRCFEVHIQNQLNMVPSILFNEEIVKQLPDGTFVRNAAGNVSHELIDPSEIFPLINPADGTQLGQMTYGQLYAALYSLYIHSALERDAQGI